jgi:uncharacterized protein YlxW (UPF0749 family)
MRTPAGSLAVAVVAVFLGVLAVSQFRAQDAFSRSLELETPSSLTTLIAGLSDKNQALRDEIFDLRLRVAAARDSVASGRGTIDEGQRQVRLLTVFAATSPVRGPGIAIAIDGPFDEKAMLDLVNELRNAGAEAVAIADQRVGARSYFAAGTAGGIDLDGRRLAPPWTVRAIGEPDVLQVAMTRTGGILSQLGLIYKGTRFQTTRETVLEIPAAR